MIKNITKNKILAENEHFASSLFDKTLGLLKSDINKTFILQTRFGIHTFGMKKEIDIIIINKHKKIVKMKQSLQPNRIFLWNPQFDLVIELPKKSIEKSKSEIGDTLSFKTTL